MKAKLVFVLALFPFLTRAQDATVTRNTGFYLLFDQDVFAPAYNEDRNYTMGLNIGVFGPFADKNAFGLPFLRKKVDHFFGFDAIHCRNDILTQASLSLYSSAFTPLDIANPNPIPGDRPYASVLMLGSGYISVNEPARYALLTEFNIGALGLNLGKAVQSYIHEHHWAGSTRPIPMGWHNQISNGGEPTMLYRLLLRRLIHEHNWPKPFRDQTMHRFQLNATAEGMVGYYTNAAIGMEARAGLFSNPFWDMYSGSSTGMNQAPPPGQKMPFFECWTYGALRMRVVGYNALLQGQFRKTDYRMTAAQINRLIGEYEMGLGVRIWRIQLLWGIIAGRSPEYSGDYSRPHIWGSAMVRANWPIQAKEYSPCEYSRH